MKNTMTARVLILSLLFAPVAVAQETGGAGAVGSESNVARPVMPNFFFTGEQRRVLEAVRQGVLEKDVFEVESFVPLLVIDQELPDLGGDVLPGEDESGDRPEVLQVGAMVRNRSTGNGSVWLNGDEIVIEKGGDVVGLRKGVEIDPKSVAEDEFIGGKDKYKGTSFQLKVGQIIGVDGSIEESLPIIVRNQ